MLPFRHRLAPLLTRAAPVAAATASTHTTAKTHELDVQSHSSKQGMRERCAAGDGNGDGGKKSKSNPKKEHPKAPEPVIGMQDERGHSKGR